ncbi:MAG: cytochrome c4 [Burkholderiales bacterium]|nr:cytochrome c4 [Burkholderiales bacterium]MDE2566800.1 cytochrome c4 [Burkholderiales bacterium]
MTQAIRSLFALAVALFALSLTSPARAQDAAAGRQKADTCMGCHGIQGYQASFPEVYKVPKLSGQNTQYLINALNEYKKGERKHPTMHAVASTLTDKDIADLAAFFHQYGAKDIRPAPATLTPPPPPAVAALIAKGACTSCHGPNLSKPIDPSYPKLAGQYASYLATALKAYATEGNPYYGRNNAIMSAQARQFTHAELTQIADYVATLPSELRTVQNPRFR